MKIEGDSGIEAIPFFSVVVPVYNKEPHIARCISSILNQSFVDFELIIICDPSNDNSAGEVEKFKDKRIRVYYRDKPGPGGYAARNLGIEKAKGKWVAFLDADDEWFVSHLAVLYKLQEKYGNSKVLGASWKIVEPNLISPFGYDNFFKSFSNSDYFLIGKSFCI